MRPDLRLDASDPVVGRVVTTVAWLERMADVAGGSQQHSRNGDRDRLKLRSRGD